MIIRKPYAFLIKYFKLIHIVMFIISTSLVFKLRDLYIFFKGYLETGTYIYIDNMVREYISMPMIFSTIFLIGSLLSVYFLMKQKQKPSLFYLISCIYYSFLFTGLIYFQSIFANIEYQNYTNQFLVIFRDIWMVLYYLNFCFLILFFIRGFGFNIKKFNFQKDIKELDISEEDREEIEVGTSFDYEKTSNFFRRFWRHFKYYIKENSYILTVFLVIFILSFTTYISLNNLVINKTYREDEVIGIDDLNYTINSSYVTNKDKYGKVIKKDKCYLIINFNILNDTTVNRKINIQNTRFKIASNYYYPLSVGNNKFSDFGIIYKEQYIKQNQDNEYILVFEIPSEYLKKINDGILELYDYTTSSGGNLVLHYKNIKLDTIYLEETDLGTFNLMETVNLDNTYYESGTFVINKYEFLSRDDYKYTKCDDGVFDGKCLEYNASVVAPPGKVLLKIEYATELPNDLVNSYLSIYYQTTSTFKTILSENIINKTPENYPENYAFILLDEKVSQSDVLELIFDVRGVKFKYKLK